MSNVTHIDYDQRELLETLKELTDMAEKGELIALVSIGVAKKGGIHTWDVPPNKVLNSQLIGEIEALKFNLLVGAAYDGEED